MAGKGFPIALVFALAACGGGGGAADGTSTADLPAADIAPADPAADPTGDACGDCDHAAPDATVETAETASPDAADDDVIDVDPAPDAEDPGPDPADDEESAPEADPGEDAAEDTPDTGPWLVPAIASCAPAGDGCGLPAAEPAIRASFRKDLYLPKAQYNEAFGELPLDGGRFHIAAVSAVTGNVTGLLVNGTNADDMLVKPKMEWYHVHPRQVVAGRPVWVQFHSRDPAWDKAATGTVVVQTDAGDAVSGTFPVAKTPAPLAYVTLTDDMATMVIHARNEDAVAHAVSRLLVNGRDATSAACIPKTTLAPGEAAMWTLPLCDPEDRVPGAAWTVVVEWADAPAAVGVGRILRPFFPVETWPNSDDCPFPGAKEDNFAKHQAAGIDTHFGYMSGGAGKDKDCNEYDMVKLVNETLPALGTLKVVLDAGGVGKGQITTTAAVAGFLTGDESDGTVWEEDGTSRFKGKAATAEKLWSWHPDVAVYNGAKTSQNIGTFAGVVDVQGMDFYVAACAPHITSFEQQPPLRGAYDYLRNARDNHRPLPTWLYAQGLAPMWGIQPAPQEITVQAWSVALAGGKGLMWFQTNMDRADENPESWTAIANASWTYRGVRAFLREGDLTGGASGQQVLADAIRARDAIVVPVVNLATTKTISAVECVAPDFLKPHFLLAANDTPVVVTVPDDFAVLEVFEVADGKALDLAWPIKVAGRKLTIGPVALWNAVPARVFVLARTADVRPAVETAMAH
jgi:hypothetical protein